MKLNEARQKVADVISRIVKTDPWVEIVLDNQVYKLEFSWSAVKAIFRETGKNLNAGDVTAEDLSNPETLAVMIFYGLQAHHRSVFEEKLDLDTMLKMKHMGYYAHCIQRGLEATQPDIEEITRIMGGVDRPKEDGPSPLAETKPSPISGPPVEFN